MSVDAHKGDTTPKPRYVELRGNIFSSKAQAIVNTVNCVGAMGKGIALEFRRRYPGMFNEYVKLCDEGGLRPGQVWPYRKATPWVLNAAIKDDWHFSSKVEWIETCLAKIAAGYRVWGLRSIAFPWMGAMNGGIPIEMVKEITRRHLRPLSAHLTIEVYEFDPGASDPLFELLRKVCSERNAIVRLMGARISRQKAESVIAAMKIPSVTSLFLAIQHAGLGTQAADHLYAALLRFRDTPSPTYVQEDLF